MHCYLAIPGMVPEAVSDESESDETPIWYRLAKGSRKRATKAKRGKLSVQDVVKVILHG